MYNVIIRNKRTGKPAIYGTYATEEQATKECEEWGWSYDDGKESYFMEYEETENNNIIENLLEMALDMDYCDSIDTIESEIEELKRELETIQGTALYNLLETIADINGNDFTLLNRMRLAND